MHREFFDKLAANWDLQITAEDIERLSSLVERLDIRSGFHVLDLGCGTGILFDILRRKVGPEGQVTGIDCSERMAEIARRNFPFENISVIDADVAAMPFQDEAFDMAISFSSFPHFADKRKALTEISRVLKPGGRCFIIHLLSSEELRKVHQRIGGVVANDVIPSEQAVRDMLAATGFGKIAIEDHPSLYFAVAEKML